MSFPLDLAAFAAAGFLLKISDFLGEKNQKRILSIGPTLLAAGSFWLLIKSNAEYSTVLLAIVIGSLVSRKVDRLNLLVGLGVLLTLMTFYGFALPLLLPLAALSVSAALDERGNDRIWRARMIDWFFRYRGVMKVLTIILGLFGQISFLTVLGFFVFDVTYDLTAAAIERKTVATKLSPPIVV